MFALEWHHDGLTAYMVFEGKIGHGDSEIESSQQWLGRHFSVANVRYGDAAFFRRLFKRTTGLTPGAYRNRFRIPDFARP